MTAKQRAEQREREKQEAAELELLVMSKDGTDPKKGYNLRDLLREERQRAKKAAKKKGSKV